MIAQVIRESRFGEPLEAFRIEEIDLPKLQPDEVLVRVMAAGVNFNGIWAARGKPVNVIEQRRKQGDAAHRFHIAGSDGSGIVEEVGADVSDIRRGDEVVLHCGIWDPACPQIRSGGDVTFSSTFRIWGYETNWGSFAEFTIVKAIQCMPRARHLTWEESAVTTLVGATAYKMLAFWKPHQVLPGDPVLIFGGAGGLGVMGIQIAKAMGGIPIAVTSGTDRMEVCKQLGAAGCIDRTQFSHWGRAPTPENKPAYDQWFQGARAFGAAIHDILGAKINPRIVFEHPGADTFPTSLFVCDTGGMVVTCGATTGFFSDLDFRYLWMRQKRVQGSHFANREQALAFNRMVMEEGINPCLARTYSFDDIPVAHQVLKDGKLNFGKIAISIGSGN